MSKLHCLYSACLSPIACDGWGYCRERMRRLGLLS
jgi:hypothetical protein